MKILSTPEALDEEGKTNLRRMKANLNCDICPYCNADQNTRQVELHITSTIWVPGRFFSRNELEEYPKLRFYVPGHWIHKDLWTCHECGTKWESDPW